MRLRRRTSIRFESHQRYLKKKIEQKKTFFIINYASAVVEMSVTFIAETYQNSIENGNCFSNYIFTFFLCNLDLTVKWFYETTRVREGCAVMIFPG